MQFTLTIWKYHYILAVKSANYRMCILNLFNLISRKLDCFTVRPDDRGAIASYLQRTFVNMQKILGTDISLEIGAHEAGYSRDVRAVLPVDAPVIAFEASPATYKYYATELSQLFDGIEYLNLAVADKSKKIEFLEYGVAGSGGGVSSGYSSMYERGEAFLGPARQKRSVEVEAVSGDDFLRRHYPDKNMAAFWIDVEGAQAEVLEGFKETFAAKKIACVYIEVELVKMWPGQKMLAEEIVRFLYEREFTAVLRDNHWVEQFNMVFVRNDLLKNHYDEFMHLGAKYMACIDNLE